MSYCQLLFLLLLLDLSLQLLLLLRSRLDPVMLVVIVDLGVHQSPKSWQHFVLDLISTSGSLA